MLEEVERLTRLVDNLLTLARGDSGKAQIVPRSMNMSSLVGTVIDDLRILAEEKGQELTLKRPPVLNVMADEDTIRLAVSNVLHNSITYAQEGGHIEVRLETIDDGSAVIDIIDDGPGIAPDQREKVFERFYRIDKARSREAGGAGLGLAIARWAVEANNGRIEFIDMEGSGSRCRITLGRGS
ncbi:MAG: hypothetical protein JSV33_05665 [bacterium]|nr:MAG: hypothetical protein JSV33_05665 [bacterium]